MLTIDTILARNSNKNKYDINETVSEYLYYIDKKPFYISSSFSEIKFKENLSARDSNIILFSAPGATGKSALARYIAWKICGLYWDLSKMKIGDNSFSGTILKAVSHSEYSEYINDLAKANSALVIDALDEAEIISGSQMLMLFIKDMYSVIETSEQDIPSMFLLARTETAQDIVSYCAFNKIPLKHYEIDFFDKAGAVGFIEAKINSQRDPIVSECIKNYYSIIEDKLSDKEDAKSFLGYAPVLQAISSHIKTFGNSKKLLNELENNMDCASVIKKIMDDILLREQNEKLLPAFMQKKNIAENINSDMLFSKDEQLVRVLNFILFNEKCIDSDLLPFLPNEYLESYEEAWNIALDQHPFLRKNIDNSGQIKINFAGPAFRDYTLARLLQCKDDVRTFAELYFYNATNDTFALSQIFFDCYMEMSRGVIRPRDIRYLYEAFKSKASAYQISKMIVEETSEATEGTERECKAIFTYEESAKLSYLEFSSSVKMDKDPICLGGISNCYIDVPDYVISFGDNEDSIRIDKSSIIAKKIQLNSKEIVFEAFSPHNVIIVSDEPIECTTRKFEVIGDGDVKIDVPNTNEYYKLIRYKFDFKKPIKDNPLGFVHTLHTIIREFRSHGKDTLGKDADKIDNVVISKSEDKKMVLEYLKNKNVIYKENHLYKINLDVMKSMGINNMILYRIDNSIDVLYKDFKSTMFDS